MGFLRSVVAAVFLLSCTASAKDVRPEPVKPFTKASVMVPVGDFSDEEIDPVKKKLDELVKKGEKQVVLAVDSHGGSVDTGYRFISYLNNLKKDGVRVSCFIDWKAFSMGIMFYEAACDDRWIAANGMVMFHEASSQAAGRAKDLKEAAELLEKLNHSIAVLAAKRMGMSVEAYEAKVAQGNWWMNADEALKANAVDAIIDTAKLPKLAKLDKEEDGGLGGLLRRLTR